MKDELYQLYRRNFPGNIRPEKTERMVLTHPGNREFLRFDGEGGLIAAAVVNGDAVLLLCVDREYRRRGIGSALLKEAEEHIAAQGFDTVRIGAGFDYLTPGVPIREENVSFFERRGYVHAWGGDECFDMAMDLSALEDVPAPGSVIRGVLYHFAEKDDLPGILECVKDAEEKFVPYYREPSLYTPGSGRRVLLALAGGETAGTLMVELETEAEKTGSVGCTAVKNAFRRRGIATNLVKIGTGALKEAGMTRGFLGYTYTGLDKMYGASGYQITSRYMMAEKKLTGGG